MAKFCDQIKFGKCQAAYLNRNAIIIDIYKNVLSIERLDQVNPSKRTFERQETNAKKSLEELKVAKRELYILLEQANHNIKDDEEYIAVGQVRRCQEPRSAEEGGVRTLKMRRCQRQ